MKPRVLHVVSDTNIGGAGRYLLYLLKQPAMKDFSIKVACPRGLLLDELTALGIDTHEMKEGDRSASLSNFREIMAFLKEGYHIVHSHASLAARVAGRLSGSIVIVTKHGLSSPRGPGRLLGRLAGLLLADHYIAVSNAVAESLLLQNVSRRRITVIHNGIDLPPGDFRDRGKALRASWSGGPLVGMVARMAEEKDYNTFFQAMPLVLEVLPEARFLAVGDGPDRPRLYSLVKGLGLEDRVIFTGHVQDVWQILGTLDILVLSSHHEGLGLAALEAMACGLPVVASRTGGLVEAIVDGESGYLFEPGSAEDLAKSLVLVSQDKAKARAIGENARERVHRLFSSQRMAEETASLYWHHLKGWKK